MDRERGRGREGETEREWARDTDASVFACSDVFT